VTAKPELLAALFSLSLLACGGKPPKTEMPEDPLAAQGGEAAGPTRTPPKASSLVKEGEGLLASGDNVAAKAKFEAQLEQQPKDARAWLGLGLAEEALEHVDAAEKAYRSAIDSDASLAEAHNNLGLLLRDKDKLDEAVHELEAAVRLDPKLASARANLALGYEDQGRAAEAADAYAAAVKLSPDDAMLRTNRGLFLLGQGDAEAALPELRAALAKGQNDRAVLAAVGGGLRRAGKPDEAVRALSGAIKAGDGKPTAALLSELALAQHAAGLKGEAKDSLEQALKLDPKNASAHYVLGSMLAGDGQKRAAIEHYQKCIELDPKGPLAERAKEKLKAAKAMH
jgi:Tfp pilus assembly protein PilF